MGGAYSALSGDPAACAYYNPATIARMDGATLSAAVNVYHKYDTQYGDLDQLEAAALRVNRGSIIPIPASSGTVYSFGNFAVGLSIVFPDFESYAGEIKTSPEVISYMNLQDQSLWVGGSLALNLTEQDAVGLTMYYTSRTFSRSVTDQLNSGGITQVTNEEKLFSHNSLIYILGYYRELNRNWSLGLSTRLPSLPISGQGSFLRTTIDTGGGSIPTINKLHIPAQTRIPTRTNLSVAYQQPRKWGVAAEATYHGPEVYDDFKDPQTFERIRHVPTWNLAIGGEYFIRPWAAWRMGLYSNLSSHQEIDDLTTVRQGDHLDMWGFSTNFALFTTNRSTVTLGGYYSGGKGSSTQLIGQQIAKIPKSVQIFSFLVGTSFQF